MLFLFHRDYISCCAKIINIAQTSQALDFQTKQDAKQNVKLRLISTDKYNSVSTFLRLNSTDYFCCFDRSTISDQFIKTCTFCSQIAYQIHPDLSLSLLPLSLSMNLYALDDINIHVKLLHSVFKSMIKCLRMYLIVYQRMTSFDKRNENKFQNKAQKQCGNS